MALNTKCKNVIASTSCQNKQALVANSNHLAFKIVFFIISLGIKYILYLLHSIHPQIPRGDSAHYIDPWDN